MPDQNRPSYALINDKLTKGILKTLGLHIHTIQKRNALPKGLRFLAIANKSSAGKKSQDKAHRKEENLNKSENNAQKRLQERTLSKTPSIS
jgi:hypothetical protein